MQPIGDVPNCRRWRLEYVKYEASRISDSHFLTNCLSAEYDSVDVEALRRELQAREAEIQRLRRILEVSLWPSFYGTNITDYSGTLRSQTKKANFSTVQGNIACISNT
jgi:hypothetical protein